MGKQISARCRLGDILLVVIEAKQLNWGGIERERFITLAKIHVYDMLSRQVLCFFLFIFLFKLFFPLLYFDTWLTVVFIMELSLNVEGKFQYYETVSYNWKWIQIIADYNMKTWYKSDASIYSSSTFALTKFFSFSTLMPASLLCLS